jgi:2-dehydropantoate 2-reductase
MNIAIMGAGGIGGYYGGLLARYGYQVTFIARGAHRKAMQKHGLHVKSVHGDFHLKPVQATQDPNQIGQPDLVLFCTKTYATEEAIRQIKPILTSNTTVLSLQNGIDSADRIGAVIGRKHVLGGTTWISSAVEAPGIIKQVSKTRRVVMGELDGRLSSRGQAIQEAFAATGVTTELSPYIMKVIWTKFIYIAAVSSLGSLTSLPLGAYRSVPETRALMTQLMQEVETVARALGVPLDKDIVQSTLASVDQAEPSIKASMQLDVEAGRRSELESMVGIIRRKGRNLGIITPVADMIYASLLPRELNAK